MSDSYEGKGQNSLDKMEDYDRLARLCENMAKSIEGLVRQVAERNALLKEKDVALSKILAEPEESLSNTKCMIAMLKIANKALAKTLPAEALDRTLAAERERCAAICTEWGNAREDESGGHALRNCAEFIRMVK